MSGTLAPPKPRPPPVSSQMVAVPLDSRTTADGLPNSELRSKGRAITMWSPRVSPRSRNTWIEEVDEAMRTSIPKVPRYILDGPPTMGQINKLYQEATAEERAQEYARALEEYQQWNTRWINAMGKMYPEHPELMSVIKQLNLR